ncbi:MAG: ribokinase [Deltaproteobacteria bacterium]|nr:ribokinase [Deltaproteobacteria bacterium]
MTEVVVVGSYVQDLAFRTTTFPNPGETRIGTFAAGPGGKGFNQAIACSRLGVQTAFLAAVGNDGFAREVQNFLRQETLDARFETVNDRSTGAASILVNQAGQNLITVALGANDAFSPEFVLTHEDLFRDAAIVVAQLECNLAPVRKAFALGKKYGAKLILNPAPINPLVDAALLHSADVLVPNETETQFLMEHIYGRQISADLAKASDSDLSEIASALSSATVIITLGAAGAFVKPATGRVFRVPAIEVAAIDTSGAGDAFTGALAAGMLRFPHAIESAVRFAVVAAGLSTQRQGTAPAMPHYHEVEAHWEARASA